MKQRMNHVDIDKAIKKLASLFEYGQLLAAGGPALLDRAAEEIISLRRKLSGIGYLSKGVHGKWVSSEVPGVYSWEPSYCNSCGCRADPSNKYCPGCGRKIMWDQDL